jgi:7-carboxy-7-deazaguanine synthase (Cx14CxxC type)
VGTAGPGGGVFRTAAELADHVAAQWPDPRPPADPADPGASRRYVVCTGGEPLLQLDDELVDALHARGFTVAIETNGTLPAPAGVDWICVSPKAGTDLVLTAGDELKLVHSQPGAEPERFAALRFDHFFLQPMDGPDRAAHTESAIAYCLAHPQWRLSVQTHKYLGIP